jgi:hypothetical protein
MTNTIIFMNIGLSLLAVFGVVALTALAHRLPSQAPRSDEAWGRSGDPWVASDPLPLVELVSHEERREPDRAA